MILTLSSNIQYTRALHTWYICSMPFAIPYSEWLDKVFNFCFSRRKCQICFLLSYGTNENRRNFMRGCNNSRLDTRSYCCVPSSHLNALFYIETGPYTWHLLYDQIPYFQHQYQTSGFLLYTIRLTLVSTGDQRARNEQPHEPISQSLYNNNNDNRLYCRLPSYKYSMVYNKDPIDKEKAIEKTYTYTGIKKRERNGIR